MMNPQLSRVQSADQSERCTPTISGPINNSNIAFQGQTYQTSHCYVLLETAAANRGNQTHASDQ